MTEKALLEALQSLCDRGFIRRYGATLRHQKTGFTANAMAAWQVDEDRIDEVGNKMASFREVSHCYRRNPTDRWPYNLYTMIHASDEDACRQTAQNMSEAASVENYTLLFSRKELKKTSMVYFPTDDLIILIRIMHNSEASTQLEWWRIMDIRVFARRAKAG